MAARNTASCRVVLLIGRVACWALERTKSGLVPWIPQSTSLTRILEKVRRTVTAGDQLEVGCDSRLASLCPNY